MPFYFSHWTDEIVEHLADNGVHQKVLGLIEAMLKSALSRLENSKAPNPTLAYLQRYAEAIGCRLAVSLERWSEPLA